VVEDRGRVRANGAELYHEVRGEDQPLILLHDGLLIRRTQDAQFADFARLYRGAGGFIQYALKELPRIYFCRNSFAWTRRKESGVASTGW
jgi:hypothetical protein